MTDELNAGLRFSIVAQAPPWLQHDAGQAVLYAPGLMLDTILQKWQSGFQARLPTECDPSCLPFIGDDRVIPQGPNEPTASYRLRLQNAFIDWHHAGSSAAVMRQVLGYVSPVRPLVRVVGDHAVWDWYPSGVGVATPYVAPHHAIVTGPSNFNWDGFVVTFRRWLILYSLSGSPWSNEGTWGDGQVWGDGGTWGSTATISDVQSLRAIVRTWKGAGAWYPWIIVSFDVTLFDPAQTADGVHNPAGTFGHWGHDVAGVMTPARFSNAIYMDGVS